jgi:hypothetical protein
MKTLAMDQISDNKYNEIWKQFSLTKINRTSDMDDQAQQVYKKMKKKKLDLSDGSALDLDNDLEEKETGENNG